MMLTLISKFTIIPPKIQDFNIRQTDADSDSERGENHTCSRLPENVNSRCSLHVIHPQLLKRNIYFCIYMFGLQK